MQRHFNGIEKRNQQDDRNITRGMIDRPPNKDIVSFSERFDTILNDLRI